MTKILMIQMQMTPYPGTAYLCGAARSAGHEFILYMESDIENIIKRIREEKPDLIGFSCMSCFYEEILHMTKRIKRIVSAPIIIGGPHPTFCPEIIEEKSIDIVCRGEGEFAMIELLDAIQKGEDYSSIQNLWVKKSGHIHKNEMRPLVDPLDKLPLIDWSCYEGSPVKSSPPIVFPIRGCPYSCSYCFNEQTRELYHGKGRYVRHLSVDRTMEEIRQAIDFFSSGPISFQSDSFGIDLDWMDELFKKYSKEIDRPFVLLLRPELVSDRCIEILAEHKCYSVAIGVESGSERIRKEVLNRNYSNERLLEIAKKLHKHHIKFRTYNMIGLPTETEEDIWATIDMNIKMKADFPRGAIFLPFPGTKIVELCKQESYLDADFSFRNIPNTILSQSILKKVDKDKIRNQLYFFQTLIKFPKSRPLVKRFIRMRPNFIFNMWFYLVYAWLLRKSEKRTWLPYIRYIFSNRKYR